MNIFSGFGDENKNEKSLQKVNLVFFNSIGRANQDETTREQVHHNRKSLHRGPDKIKRLLQMRQGSIQQTTTMNKFKVIYNLLPVLFFCVGAVHQTQSTFLLREGELSLLLLLRVRHSLFIRSTSVRSTSVRP